LVGFQAADRPQRSRSTSGCCRAYVAKIGAELLPVGAAKLLGFHAAEVIVQCMRTKASAELDAGAKRFASGLPPGSNTALRRSRPGDQSLERTFSMLIAR
jgi:hypothetical protein